jgi:hypothetical protein
VTNALFYLQTTCGGGLMVSLAVRAPQTAGSDVICWNVNQNSPCSGDKCWSYTNGYLVNNVNHLALKINPLTKNAGLGTSSTDGTPLTIISNNDNTVSFQFTDGTFLGIGNLNCAGGIYQSGIPSMTFLTRFGMNGS